MKKWIAYTIVVAIFMPFGYLLLLSMASDWAFPDLWPNYLGFKNWQAILKPGAGLVSSLGLSMAISLAVAFSSTAVGFYLSRVVQQSAHRRKLQLFNYFPYLLAPVVFASCLSYFFIRLGILGQWQGVVIAQFMISLPYAIIFFGSFWNERVDALEKLVATLGGNRWQTYLKVLLPMAKGLLLICFFQTFLISWFEYGLTSVIGVGKVQTLTIKVFLFIKESNFYYGALSCILLLLPPVLFLYINKRFVFNQTY